MLKYLIEKEFKQIKRDSFIPKLIIAMPIMVMLVLPWAANQEIKDINLYIIDNDHSTYSQRLTNKIISSGYFKLSGFSSSNKQALRSIELGESDIIFEIQDEFENNLINSSSSKVLITANAVNGIKSGLGSSYLASILNEFSVEMRNNSPQNPLSIINPIINISTENRFNTYMDYKVFMIPALMVMILTLICGFLPALNIVSEKEKGTMEQINVTPVNKFIYIISKLIPYWIVGFIVLSLCLGLVALVYGLYPSGSLLTIYSFASIYILVVSGLGLVISNYSNTMQQAMFVMFFFMMLLILMSGLFTPISSMPEWAQTITIFNPLKYFMQVMRMVYLKASNIENLINQLIALISFAIIFNSWAVLSYRKSK